MSVYTSNVKYYVSYNICHTSDGCVQNGEQQLEQRIAGSMKETRDTIECKRYTTPS